MKVKLKRLQKIDLKMVMKWRILPEVTKYMNTNPTLNIEKQNKWFESIKNDKTKICWVINYEQVPIGILNLIVNYNKSQAELGYYIAEKQFSSLKLISFLEWNLYEYAFDFLNLNRLFSYTFVENKLVVLLHSKCGMKIISVLKNHILKNDRYYDVCEHEILLKDWLQMKDKINYERFEFE